MSRVCITKVISIINQPVCVSVCVYVYVCMCVCVSMCVCVMPTHLRLVRVSYGNEGSEGGKEKEGERERWKEQV